MRVLRLLVPIAGSLALLTGCGGSSNRRLSYSAFSSAADAICKGAGVQSAAAGSLTATASGANAEVLDKVIAAMRDGVTKLKALEGAPGLESARDTLVNDLDQQLSLGQAASNDARSGNQAGYVSAATEVAALSQQANVDGSRLGAPDCAKGA